jgi:hypothetical protein
MIVLAMNKPHAATLRAITMRAMVAGLIYAVIPGARPQCEVSELKEDPALPGEYEVESRPPEEHPEDDEDRKAEHEE